MDDNNPIIFDEEKQPLSPISGEIPTANNSSDEGDTLTRRIITSIIVAMLAVGCGIFCVAAVLFLDPAQLSSARQFFASPTATITPTPTSTPTPTALTTSHVLITPPGEASILEERFDSNSREWDTYYGDATFRIQDGKLHLRSDKAGNSGLALCNGCPLYQKAFYYQAEVVPAEKTSMQHGIAFCATGFSNEYYIFQIDSVYQGYTLLKSTPLGWEPLIEYTTSTSINEYPASNVLGVQFDNGRISLYINADLVNSREDADPADCRRLGIFINDGLVDVIADNVFAYQINESPTPTATP